ncbi:uncharacterized protein [Dendrobates tinctorius]|uniref:uncharacterized protein n=1 Tax=Dendrobates tinctorius TaxID=92724 RepID=UPI003CCA2BF9
MQAPCGSGGRRSKYKYAHALSFLRTTMVTRSTVSSTREPAQLDPSGAILHETATEVHFDCPRPSAPSQPALTSDPTSAGASWPTPFHESAGEEIAFPLPHPSAAATSSTPAGTGRQQQRGQERIYAPEFLHLNASFQNCLKVLSEQIAAGFNMLSNSILEVKTLLQSMHSDARQTPNNTFFWSVLERIDGLSPDQQMHVMQSCHTALAQVTSKAPPPTPVIPPTPALPSASVPPPPHIQYQQPPQYQQPHHYLQPPQYQQPPPYHQPATFQHPSPYHFPTTSSAPPVPAQPSSPPPTTSSASHMSSHSYSFSTPSPLLPTDPSPPPPPSLSSLHTPNVEVSQSPSSIISTQHYVNL